MNTARDYNPVPRRSSQHFRDAGDVRDLASIWASIWRRRASTRSMISSGVEVPAVSPTTVAAS
jgi:hypothetical protein